jgi:hypothetical protein
MRRRLVGGSSVRGGRGLQVMQLAGVDQVEAFFADVLEAPNDLAFEWLHAAEVSPMSAEVEINARCRVKS